MGAYHACLHGYYGNSGAGYYGGKVAESFAEGRVSQAVGMTREALVKASKDQDFDLGEMLRVLEESGTRASVAHPGHEIGMLHLVEAHLINLLKRRQTGSSQVTH